MRWEWIAATVQAIRWHVAVEMNRGGPVAAVSLSTVHALRSTPGSRTHCFAVWCDSSLFPPHPTPNASLSAFVLQLHISVKSVTMGVGGCMG